MAFLPEQDQQALREKFATEMQADVRLHFFTMTAPVLVLPGQAQPEHDYQYLRQAQELMQEVTALSPKLSLDVHDIRSDTAVAREYRIDKVPALVVQVKDTGLRFFGLPAGYEFSTFIQDVIDLSTGNIQLSEETQTFLRGLEQDVHLQVFVTPT